MAVTDVDTQLNEQVAGEFGVKACADIDELLAMSELDAVYIATPTHCHKEQILKAIQAGKHVLCEKPLALNSKEAGEIVKACDEAKRVCGVGFMMRFNSYHRKVLEMVQAGQLGAAVMGRAQLTCWYPPIKGAWRQDKSLGGGGAVPDLASHCIDLLEMFFGRTVEVTAMTGNLVHDYPVEDSAAILLRFESGAFGLVEALFNVPDAASEYVLEIQGSKGVAKTKNTVCQASSGELRVYQDDARKDYDADQRNASKTYVSVDVPEENIYQAQIEAFSRAILENSEPPISAWDGAWNVRVIDAVYQSVHEKRIIALKP
jgi:predicted dehydrogenase